MSSREGKSLSSLCQVGYFRPTMCCQVRVSKSLRADRLINTEPSRTGWWKARGKAGKMKTERAGEGLREKAGAVSQVAVALVKRRAFCERCEQWCSQSQKLYFAPVLSADQFKARLEAEDLASLQTLAPGDPKKPHFRVDLHSCADCHTLNTLSLVQNFARDRDETILMGLAPCVRCSRKRLLTTSFRMNAQNCRTVL